MKQSEVFIYGTGVMPVLLFMEEFMKVRLKTSNLPHDEWLKARAELGIGGSEASVICGINPYKSVMDLYLEKTGQVELTEIDNDYIYWGKAIEPLLRKRFTEITGKPVRQKHAIMYDPEHQFMIADFDGIVSEPDGSKAILEIKTASQYKLEEWQDGVPEIYRMQCLHYLSVSGYQKCYVICLIGGNNVVIREVYRDEEKIAELRRKEEEFWYCVQKRIEPEVDGSPATTTYLSNTYNTSNGETVVLPEELLPVFDEYDLLVKTIDELNLRKEEICNQFRNSLKENEVGAIAGRKVKWKTMQSTRFNSSKFKEDHPEMYDSYTYKNQYRRLQIA